MASSSLSQEDFEADYETTARRTRVRTARARNVNAVTARGQMDPPTERESSVGGNVQEVTCCSALMGATSSTAVDGSVAALGRDEHEASPKPAGLRAKDKRTRANHMGKGKQQRDRRKLREKRRSTGVVHLPSTESTGGSTGEDEDELLSLNAETKRNTMYNEIIDRENNIYTHATEEKLAKFTSRRNKSPSDLEADDEDNQDYDSTVNQSNSNASLVHEANAPSWMRASNGRPQTPSSENMEELLERAREENKNLLELLEKKDLKIIQLEKDCIKLNRELQTAGIECEKVKEENKALIRAMSQLTVK